MTTITLVRDGDGTRPAIFQDESRIIIGNLAQNMTTAGSSVAITSGDAAVTFSIDTDNSITRLTADPSAFMMLPQLITAPLNFELSSTGDNYISFGPLNGMHIKMSSLGTRICAGRLDISMPEACTQIPNIVDYLEYFRLLRTAEVMFKSSAQINAMTIDERDTYYITVNQDAYPLLGIEAAIEAHIELAAIVTDDLTPRFNAIFNSATADQITPYAIKLQNTESTYLQQAAVSALTASEYTSYSTELTNAFAILDAYEADAAVAAELIEIPNPSLTELYARRHAMSVLSQNNTVILTDSIYLTIIAYYFDQTTDISGTGVAPSLIGTHLGPNSHYIKKWDVSALTTLNRAFNGRSTFNEPLDTWDVSGVTDLSFTFYKCAAFTQDLNTWDVSNVTLFTATFTAARSFNGDIDNWDMSSATALDAMFQFAWAFDRDITGWDVAKVTTFRSTLQGARTFNHDITKWNYSSATTVRQMMGNTLQYEYKVDTMTIPPNISVDRMFASPSKLTGVYPPVGTPRYADFKQP